MTPQAADTARPVATPPLDEADVAPTGRAVVGVDGSETSASALRWTFGQAVRHGWVVDVVTAWPDRSVTFVHEVPGHHNEHRYRAVVSQRRVLDAVAATADFVPPVRTFVENARPVEALARHGAGASMVVVGASRHRGAEPVSTGLVATGALRVVVVGTDDSRLRRAP